ncbi:MAG: amidase, partial [Rhodospirillaceae bacterium]|nr:amidase [Rhodospirillaceae bacterium]
MADSFPGYESFDGLALADLVRRREASPVELLDAAIARIERANPHLNAVIAPLYDRARRTIAAGLPQGPFTGVPFLLKDLGQMLPGERLSFGSRLFADYVPDRASTLTARYLAAGLVVAGKTNTPELGCSITTEPAFLGPSRNPWNRDHTPGGSSGGAAAAVASGMVPIAHGGDGGGSIRAPAALCGIYGFKPSRARNPVGPDVGESLNGLSCNHVLSWTVRDSAAMLDATHGPEPGDPYQVAAPERPFLEETAHDPAPLRIALSTKGPMGVPVDPDCAAAAEDAAKLLAEMGHIVEEATPDYDADAIHLAWRMLIGPILAVQVAGRAKAAGIADPLALLEPVNAAWVEEGRRRPATDYFRAEMMFQTAGRRMGAFF